MQQPDAKSRSFAEVYGFGEPEVRVLGCLMEKQLTTPDAYPLSLNSLRLACNQSTNRDPVVDYDESLLRDALHRLERRGYARLASGRGSRAAKYRHLLSEALPLSGDEHAVLCVLLLRGAQTPGELKQRTERMHAFAGLDAINETLERLIARALVARLERRPGQKEERYEHLFGAGASAGAEAPAPSSVPQQLARGRAAGRRHCAAWRRTPRARRCPGWRSGSRGWSAKSPTCARARARRV